MKYKGLKFYNVFQSDDFIFLPTTLTEELPNEVPIDIESNSCKYDKNAEFYVLLKHQDDEDVQIKKQLAKFKFLEGVLMFLFTNKFSRMSLFTLEIEDNDVRIKKVIKYPLSELENEHSTLLWKNKILIDYLQQVLNEGFKIFKELQDNQEKFAEEFYFSIGMYLKGKHSEETLNIITSLWISLEVFSTITILYIFKTDSNLIGSGLSDFKKCLKKLAPYYIPKDESECWEPLKEKYYEHIVNKITTHLPIKQKIKTLVNKTLNDDNIVLPVNLTYKKLVNYFYDNRNNVVHNGKLPKIIGMDLSRKQALLSMMIERLIVKILGLQKINFLQFGDHEYLFMKFKGKIEDYYGNYSGAISTYIYSKFPFPSFEDWNSEGYGIDTELRNHFSEINAEYRNLIIKLNETSTKILDLFSSVMNLELRCEETSKIFIIEFKEFSGRTLRIKSMLDEEKSFFSYTKAWIEEIEVNFKSLDTSSFTISFSGYIEKIKKNTIIIKTIPNQLEFNINT